MPPFLLVIAAKGRRVMAIHHASSGELIDSRPLKEQLKATATKPLFKSNHLEVSRTVLLAGKVVLSHQARSALS